MITLTFIAFRRYYQSLLIYIVMIIFFKNDSDKCQYSSQVLFLDREIRMNYPDREQNSRLGTYQEYY